MGDNDLVERIERIEEEIGLSESGDSGTWKKDNLPTIGSYQMKVEFDSAWVGGRLFLDHDGDLWVTDQDGNPVLDRPDFINAVELKQLQKRSADISEQ
jgi:hypothetical protein